jgi:hypothetical protein
MRARNATVFPAVASGIDDIDGTASEMSIQRIEAQAAKLLVIGGDLWVVCRPPSWRVEVNEDRVTLDLAVAIEGFDPLLSRRHFPLDRFDEAQAYARQCGKTNAVDGVEPTKVEYIVDYEAAMPELLDFDGDAEELARIGYALAAECMRYGKRNPLWLDKLESRLKESLFRAYAATLETDYVRGNIGDVTPYVEDLCVIWKRFHRPLGYCELGPVRAKSGDVLIAQAKSLMENAPITLGTQLSNGPTALPGTPR